MRIQSHFPFTALLARPFYTIIGVAIIGVAITADAIAGEDVDVTKEVPPTGVVRIENVRGELTIIGWDENEAKVEGELDDIAESLRFEVNDDQTLIRVQLPERDINWGDGSDLTIHVPHGSHLQVVAVSADVQLEGISGDINIRTVSGDVRGRDLGDATHINTVSGDIKLSEGSGSLNIVTVSGDARIELDAIDVAIDTMSGEIELELGDFDRLQAHAVNGELEIEGRLNIAGTINSATVNGDIELRLRDPLNASIEVRTGPGGEITNDLTEDPPRELFPNSMELQTAAGDGSGGIRIITVNGEVHLESG